MFYSKEIVPCYDAMVYLTQRFTKNRASGRIKDYHAKRSVEVKAEVWERCEKISEIEKKLDERFQPDELMLRYFSPLSTVNSLVSNELSFGKLLLHPTTVINEPVCFDSIVDFYRTSPQEEITSHFSSLLFSFFAPDDDYKLGTLNELVTLADKVLIKPDDKWLLIDIVLNPLVHLEKLRPLVCETADAIAELTADLGDFLEEAGAIVTGLGQDRVLKKLNLHFKPNEIRSLYVHPSFMSFNLIGMCSSQCAEDLEKRDVQIFIGIYVCYGIADDLSRSQNLESFLFTLKLISDPTRFQIMRELCDKRSYGQELAQSFNCTRSAMYYHLEKLMDNRLIDQQITGYRMLYTLNKQNVYDKFNDMRDYILKGWKPEDDEKKAEVEEEKE